jgi:hypothetical protein
MPDGSKHEERRRRHRNDDCNGSFAMTPIAVLICYNSRNCRLD